MRPESSSLRSFLCATLFLLVPFVASAESSAGFTLFGVTPTLAGEGDEIFIQGSGFSTNLEDYSIYLRDGDAGAPLEVLEATPTLLRCRVEPYATDMSGELHVRTGHGTHLPQHLYSFDDRNYLVSSASWFTAEADHLGPVVDLLTPLGNLPLSAKVTNKLQLVLHHDGHGPSHETEVKIILEQQVDPSKGPKNPLLWGGVAEKTFTEGPTWTGVAARLTVQFLPTTPQILDSVTRTTDLAAILQATFGPFGLSFTTDGNTLRIGYVHGITEGFAVVSP